MRRTIAVVAGAAILIAGASGGAGAAHLIGSGQVRDNSLRSADIKDGTLAMSDLRPAVQARLNTALTQSQAGQISGYQIVSKTHTFTAGGRAEDTLWCPAGKVALGGFQSNVPDGADAFKVEGSYPMYLPSRPGHDDQYNGPPLFGWRWDFRTAEEDGAPFTNGVALEFFSEYLTCASGSGSGSGAEVDPDG